MQQITKPPSPSDQEVYLEALEELTIELKRASNAVKIGALSDFENSLARQRIGYKRLVELAAPHSAMAAAAVPVLATRFRAAVADLEHELRYYSMLLKHFGETSRVFAGIFRSYGGSARFGSPFPKSQSAWSCEL